MRAKTTHMERGAMELYRPLLHTVTVPAGEEVDNEGDVTLRRV